LNVLIHKKQIAQIGKLHQEDEALTEAKSPQEIDDQDNEDAVTAYTAGLSGLKKQDPEHRAQSTGAPHLIGFDGPEYRYKRAHGSLKRWGGLLSRKVSNIKPKAPQKKDPQEELMSQESRGEEKAASQTAIDFKSRHY